jgi:hypothetical protein
MPKLPNEMTDTLRAYAESVGAKYAHINDLFINHKRPDPAREDFKAVARCFHPELLGNTPAEVACQADYLRALEENVARQLFHSRLLPLKIRNADRDTVVEAYKRVKYSLTTIAARDDIDAPYVVFDPSLYAISATEVYTIFEKRIIDNNGLTADFNTFEEGMEDGHGSAVIIGRNIPNYIRAGIYLTTDRDFDAARRLLSHYRQMETGGESISGDGRWVARII